MTTPGRDAAPAVATSGAHAARPEPRITRMPSGRTRVHYELDPDRFQAWGLAAASEEPSDEPWWLEAGNPPGWLVEAQVRLSGAPTSGCEPTTTLTVDDGAMRLDLEIGANGVTLRGADLPPPHLPCPVASPPKPCSPPVASPPPRNAALPTTTAFHVYRLEASGGAIAVLADDKPLFELAHQPGFGAGNGPVLRIEQSACAASHWRSIAYETWPTPPLAWPSRDQWHPGARPDRLLDVLRAELPAPVAKRLAHLAVPAEAAACVAVWSLDAGVRELLARAYGMRDRGAALRDHEPLSTRAARADAMEFLGSITRPIEDPGCDARDGGAPCAPRRAPRARSPRRRSRRW